MRPKKRYSVQKRMMRSLKRTVTLWKLRKIGQRILKNPGSWMMITMLRKSLRMILKWFRNIIRRWIGKMALEMRMSILGKGKMDLKRKMLRLNGTKLWNLPLKTFRFSRCIKMTVFTGIMKARDSISKMTWVNKLKTGMIYLTRKKKRSFKPLLAPWFS